jgi:hypothetical protein
LISSSSQNKQSSNKHDSKSSKNMLLDGQKWVKIKLLMR